jgi:2-hydroxychromene-2-carboxylate isomerase
MTKSIDFYFDIISPYSYLAHKKIKKNSKDKNILFNYKPILLGGLHKLAEITAPAFNQFKMKNMKNDCELVSNKNHIPFKWNEKFPINSISIMRGYLFINKEKRKDYLDKFFNAYWRDNVDLSIQENFINILNTLEIDQASFLDGISNEKIKEKLKELTSEAFNKEIFGAPTFIYNNKIFWGQDRLEYAIDEFLNKDN